MINILFTCAGRRNYLINYFKESLGSDGKVIAMDMQETAPALIDADIGIKAPSIYDRNYIDFLKKNISKYNISALVSLNDLELPLLSENKKILSDGNVKIIVSDKEVITKCFDKWETVIFLKKIGLKTPKTYKDIRKVKLALANNEIEFPLVVKPRWGSCSINVDFVYDDYELELVYKIQEKKLKNSILFESSKQSINSAILIQEKIDGIEYGMDILNDFRGEYYDSFAREKILMRSGETDKAMSVINKKLLDIGKKIGTSLNHIGNLDCDIFFDGKDYYVLELNPRFGGGYPFSHEAGINTCAIYIEWIKKNSNISKFNNYKSNVVFSKCDRLLNVSKGFKK